MSLQKNLNRIKNIKDELRQSILNKNIDISSTSSIETYSSFINKLYVPTIPSDKTITHKTTYYRIKYSNDGDCSSLFRNMQAKVSMDDFIIGNNVTNMYSTYNYCNYLTGNPACGVNVTDMNGTYFCCKNLTGSPVCGNNVINMYSTYAYCNRLTGSPVCGDKVTHMYYTYADCTNLTGGPVCGPNVINMSRTYSGCTNLSGNGYFYSNKIQNTYQCFYGKNNSKRLNLYVPSTGYNTSHNTLAHCLYNNTYSLVGSRITWTQSGSNYYNTTYNIYIYPVANVAAARAANGD